MLRLDALTSQDVEKARQWRNTDAVRASLRTPFMLTKEMQEAFYDTVLCNRAATVRYWAVRRDEAFVAMAGLTDIAWENGSAEISLLLDPVLTGQGTGKEIVHLVLTEAFENMRLLTVYGECYLNNDAVGFWESIAKLHNGTTTTLPRRKWWGGQLWDSLYFSLPAPS